MTPGDREALEALCNRLVHAEAVANAIARGCPDLMTKNALVGLGEAIGDLSAKVDAVLDRHPS